MTSLWFCAVMHTSRWLCSWTYDWCTLSRVQRRKYVTIVNIYAYNFVVTRLPRKTMRCQEKSYPGEIVPKRNRTQLEWVRFLQNTLGTISHEISYPGYNFFRDIVPFFLQFYFDIYCTVEKYPGYDFTWDIVPRVQFFQRYRTLFFTILLWHILYSRKVHLLLHCRIV